VFDAEARSGALPETQTGRHLAAILAADVAGYSRLMGTDEDGTLAQLKDHRTQVWDRALARHRGRIANTAGDSILAEFSSVLTLSLARWQFRRKRANATQPYHPTDAWNFALVSIWAK